MCIPKFKNKMEIIHFGVCVRRGGGGDDYEIWCDTATCRSMCDKGKNCAHPCFT